MMVGSASSSVADASPFLFVFFFLANNLYKNKHFVKLY